jgi:sugar phosphate isomerase/epimerase
MAGNDPNSYNRASVLSPQRHRGESRTHRAFPFWDKPGPNYPGTGNLELKPFIDLLKALHFDRTFGLEFFPGRDSEKAVTKTSEQVSLLI